MLILLILKGFLKISFITVIFSLPLIFSSVRELNFIDFLVIDFIGYYFDENKDVPC